MSYRHSDLELGGEGLYWRDKINLSDIGNDIFNVGIQNTIEKALLKWRTTIIESDDTSFGVEE